LHASSEGKSFIFFLGAFVPPQAMTEINRSEVIMMEFKEFFMFSKTELYPNSMACVLIFAIEI
jgi:hypothetical protein